jgi:hypothetical protein
MMIRLPLLLLLALTLSACDEGEERYEEIKKLRSVGVAANPVAITPLLAGGPPQIVTLTFYAAVPLGGTVTYEPFIDEAAKYAATVPLVMSPGSEKYEDHIGFRIFSVDATAVLPPAEALPIPPVPGFVAFRYGLILRSAEEEERVVGNFLVYPPGAAQLTWTAPTVDISGVASGATLPTGKHDLNAVLTNTNDEKLRIAWFVSGGKLRNRRNKETVWEAEDAGPYSIMLTARGLKSGAFAPPKVIDVAVE